MTKLKPGQMLRGPEIFGQINSGFAPCILRSKILNGAYLVGVEKDLASSWGSVATYYFLARRNERKMPTNCKFPVRRFTTAKAAFKAYDKLREEQAKLSKRVERAERDELNGKGVLW